MSISGPGGTSNEHQRWAMTRMTRMTSMTGQNAGVKVTRMTKMTDMTRTTEPGGLPVRIGRCFRKAGACGQACKAANLGQRAGK